ncbi:MAG: carbamate kinase [Candidatus Marinimicrobia bacterium]|nr:carbamate kinase [Candidatus Neomarinimicrobiota bacterium]
MKVITIALGGNALGNSPVEQQRNIEKAVPSLVDLITQGHKIILTHGNGPQVGMIYKAFEFASANAGRICRFDLQECTAMSQGYIGYHLQKGIKKELRHLGMPWHVSTVVSQMEVDKNDISFQVPSKPIGDFYTEAEARMIMRSHPEQIFKEDSGRGWRRVVASPQPLQIVEAESILNLLDHKFIVIACGGGGIPVIKDHNGDYIGVSAVIDKDHSAALLADLVEAHYLFILTPVDRVAINFGKKDQRDIAHMTVAEARRYINEGHFAAGSMLPKVEAAVKFVRGGRNRKAVITSLEKAHLAMNSDAGTLISNGE